MSYLKIYNGYENVVSGSSDLAAKESNDCVVRAFASAANVAYEVSHEFCKKFFARRERSGVYNGILASQLLKAEEEGLTIGNREYSVQVLGKSDITNRYKVNSKIVYRQKTLKSFIESHLKGTYIVTVAKHAVCIKDGELHDWSSLTFKPTRRVLKAYKLEQKNQPVQLTLF
jgi:hypothetical protein